MPPYPDDGLSILKSQVSSLKSQGHTSLAFDFKLESSDLRLPADLRLETSTLRRPEAIGSNAWVVDGSLTASGRPLLANDPHLTARLPSLWYLAHIAARDYEAIGATMPGTPAVVLGRNRWIAWGATNVAADVQDLYWERLDPTGRFARFRGRWEPLEFIRETIAVRGRAPVQLDVRVSRHGPLVSDAINANNAEAEVPARRALPPLEPLALRWTALDPDDTTVAAIMRLSEARDWSEFRLALQDFVVPAQNFVYADTAGHIGYSAPGRIPVRAAGDGAQPSEGWTGASEWTGWIPFGELPHTYDPPEHAIIAANQRPMPVTYPHHLGLEWPEAYRAQRIAELLRGRDKLTPDHFSMIQADTVSLHARVLLPVLLERARPEDAADLQAVRLLREWDYDTRGTSAPAAIFEAWFLALTPTLVGDELGSVTTESYAGRFSYVTRFLLQLLGSGSPGGSGSPPSINRRTHRAWCDDTRTPQKETCEQAVTQALHDALRELTGRLGRDMTKWRWDAVHQAVFPHQGLSAVPGLRLLFSRSVPSGGDWSTVDVGAVAVERPYEQQSIASYRQILDLSPANDSRFADAIGQSGHPLSDRYDDALERWRAVKHVPMRLDRAAIERGAVGRLYLRPVGNPKVKSQNAKGH
jgi:penicillin amidase